MTRDGSAAVTSLGVVGCGLIGSSFALASRAVGIERVVIADRDARVREEAVDRGIADKAVDRVDEVEADLVVVAVPVAEIGRVATRLLERDDPPVVTDVGSTKARVVAQVEAWAEASGRDEIPFVGGHPIAGSERGGIDAADATLFQGAAYVLTPTTRTDAEAFGVVSTHLRSLGCRVIAMAPDEHDRAAGIMSHLPHVLATGLASYAAHMARSDPGLLSLAGGGFRDATRVAASDVSLWTGILTENQQAVVAALDGYADRLAEIRALIADDRWDELETLLASARDARQMLSAKDVAGPLVDLVIPVEDRPGALADVSTALGGSGINIEDLSMRHAETGDKGALVVTVTGIEAAEAAQEVLAARGYPSHLEPR